MIITEDFQFQTNLFSTRFSQKIQSFVYELYLTKKKCIIFIFLKIET